MRSRKKGVSHVIILQVDYSRLHYCLIVGRVQADLQRVQITIICLEPYIFFTWEFEQTFFITEKKTSRATTIDQFQNLASNGCRDTQLQTLMIIPSWTRWVQQDPSAYCALFHAFKRVVMPLNNIEYLCEELCVRFDIFLQFYFLPTRCVAKNEGIFLTTFSQTTGKQDEATTSTTTALYFSYIIC